MKPDDDDDERTREPAERVDPPNRRSSTLARVERRDADV
jgi:hypothetical protein